MGSFDNKDPFVCCSGDCLRKAWVDHDMGGFLCFVCDQRDVNQRAVHTLNALLSKNPTPTLDGTPTFQDLLAEENLCIKILEGVFGDGWDEQCPCRLCNRKWLNAGWVCLPCITAGSTFICWTHGTKPSRTIYIWRRRTGTPWCLRYTSSIIRRQSLSSSRHPAPHSRRRLRTAAGIAAVGVAAAAAIAAVLYNRRHSRSRSRSRSSHRSSVVQPAHISKQWCTSCTGAHLCLRPHLAASRRYEAPRDFDTSRITAATLQPQML